MWFFQFSQPTADGHIGRLCMQVAAAAQMKQEQFEAAVQEASKVVADNATSAGYSVCDATHPETGQCCDAQFWIKKRLIRHKQKNKHRFLRESTRAEH